MNSSPLRLLRIQVLSLLSVILFFSCSQPENLDAYLTELHQEGKLNGNVLIVQKDSVVYEKSFGYADGTKKQKLSADYRFGIGSIYKEFPAVAIMQLQEAGRLSLYDTLSSFVPHLPGWADKITINHLLQYSSGLPKVDWEAHFSKGKAIEKEIVADLTSLESLEFTPGTNYLYSNYNPFLLMRIVSKLTGMEFNAYVEQHLLAAHKIEGVVIKEGYPYQDASLMAISFDEQFKEDDYKAELTNVCSTARGMYHWFSKLDGFQLVSKASVRQLSEEAIEGDNIQAPLGRCDWADDDIVMHLHHGSTANYEALVRHYKQEGLIIVLLTNQKQGNLHDIADQLYAMVTDK